MRTTFHWFGRVLFLVFAGFATLSIIGSIAAIPSGGTGGRTLFAERAVAPLPSSPEPQDAVPAEPSPDTPGAPAEGNVAAASGETAVLAPAPPPPPDPVVRWLEPITYALIAIAALLAAVVLLLWRIGSAIRDAGLR